MLPLLFEMRHGMNDQFKQQHGCDNAGGPDLDDHHVSALPFLSPSISSREFPNTMNTFSQTVPLHLLTRGHEYPVVRHFDPDVKAPSLAIISASSTPTAVMTDHPSIPSAPTSMPQAPADRDMEKGNRATVRSREEWEAKKEVIRQLWIVEDRPWQSRTSPEESVENILRSEYAFPVT
jgi:hypothetical protein